MRYTKKAVITSACIALCIILPMIFHTIPNAGNVWLPMHIPVLLCGLVCGWKFGLLCGILGPFVSSILTQMPPAVSLPAMVCELSVYGIITGITSELIRTGKTITDSVISLLISMICGRIVYGIVNSLLFRAGNYSIQTWLTASFVTALPGIILQLVLIPAIINSLEKSGLIPQRYS